ncbi:anaphase-promoting complex subunit 1 [Teleopsis dalmanni]|uniref:anaphase-promoting complex subunit 1 n=1 Tax=Teleopsis dalmanni TaxID=139649 RepID=UPI0018CD83ED|nr:anaphase-promoting complex subunit 1 [Teleopsis dalmanni]
MIEAAEPLEFIPQGRLAFEEHPGPLDTKNHLLLPSEYILLQRLQNVNISEPDEHNEFWCLREIYEDCSERKVQARIVKPQKKQTFSKQKFKPPKIPQPTHDYMCDYVINSEEELYIKKHTAFWTRGISDDDIVLPRLCFTCETPIKFGFFCNKSFIIGGKHKKNNAENDNEDDISAVCLIDSNSLRVYCSNGEDFLNNLEFPVSNVWPTRFGILLEKVASKTVVQNMTIAMPRLFSLSHPLDEICPVLNKTSTNIISYLIESDYIIIFSSEISDLLLLYDNKIGKHFVSRLRRATEEEINAVGGQNETGVSVLHNFNSINRGGVNSYSHNSMKFTGATSKNSTTNYGRSSLANSNYSSYISKFFSGALSMSGAFGNLNRTTPLNHLQSTMGQHSILMHDMRKGGQSQPSKPIVPELCLEHIWTENIFGNNREFCEISSKAFLHTDLLGETFLCYLLSRSSKLQLVRLTNYPKKILQISTMSTTIPAKDAVCLERMKMIAVLDPSGSLILYTGGILVSKVHVGPVIMPPTGTILTSFIKSPNLSFPRRSSLLPTVQKPGDSTFDDELHFLSPVHPLQPTATNRCVNAVCLGLRDPVGNRLTLVYPSDKMYRIALPLINETKFISRCISALRQILKKEEFLQMIIRWYAARNPPGSRDYTIEQEWKVFMNLLLELMGLLASNNDTSASTSTSFNAEEPKKRKKNDEITEGTDEDWTFMLKILDGKTENNTLNITNNNRIDTNACLFKKVPSIFCGLHLLYEDFKLDESLYDCLPYLAKFLHQMAIDMELTTYIFHYTLDFPKLAFKTSKEFIFTEQHAAQMLHKEFLIEPAPSIYMQLEYILKGNLKAARYSYVDGINNLSRNILQIISLIMHGHKKSKNWIKPLSFSETVETNYQNQPKRCIFVNVPRSEQVIQLLIMMGIKRKDIERLPIAIHLIIAQCLEYSRLNPPIGCTPATYELILRSELVEHAKLSADFVKKNCHTSNPDIEDSLSARCPPSRSGIAKMEAILDDGMDNIDTKLLSLRFPDDMRIAEVRRLLTSSESVLIDITQSPGTSDHDFIEEQEKQLFAMCTRTMTLPMGRGMFTLRTSMPTPTESMPIPKLCLTGKEPIKGATIEMQQIEFPANMSLWPTFHNGVAAGLKISPNARDVDSTWIVYNKPKGQTDISTEHAGFLMALGLNGHLKTLSFMSVYEYLVKCDEMTSIGLLLGISATHRGTMDNTTTKLLSVHIEALLPATALELDIPQNIQVASLMGIGLVYQSTAKRHIAEVLLQEVGRPPGPEMENSIERESYALTAGLALGLVTLGQGESPAGLRDLQLPDTLHYYMVGGNKRNLTGSQKEKYKLPSFQVREGDNVNIDVTAPGATLALGLMFFNTNNRAVAEWMDPPNTRYLLDLVRPDLLLLRTIARGLILWSNIEPSENWLFNQFPENLRFDIMRGATVKDSEDIDHEAITQAYCNIIAGAAFCIGIKYAGTENQEAFKTLRMAIKMFLGFPGKYIGEFAGRTTIETSLMLILVSISLVFAGSGDLEILRIIRYLRSRIGPQHSQVTYGSHLAIHMSLGLLFLGAGRFTIAKTPEAVAALVCAFFPKFPNHSNDNRYHLQAFRHLYVLAVEPRLFLPRDIDTKKLCLCSISVLEVGSKELKRIPMAPCMLPNLDTLQKVIVDDPNYWPVCFEKNRNWQQLINALKNSACIDIKKRSGCLSHLEDPDRLKSLFAQTLTTEQYNCWEIDTKTLERFSNESYVIAFTDRFLHMDKDSVNDIEYQKKQQLTLLFYNAVIRDKMHVLPIYLAIFDHICRIKKLPSSIDVWQIKLIDTYIDHYQKDHILFSKELVNSNLERLKLYFENSLHELNVYLKLFVSTSSFDASILADLSTADMARLMAIINYYNLTPNVVEHLNISNTICYEGYLYELAKNKLEPRTIFSLIKILLQNSD